MTTVHAPRIHDAERSVRAPRGRRRGRRWRSLVGVPIAVVAAALGLWVALHRVPWLGPGLADAARAVVGTAAVTKLEEWAYAVDDAWGRLWHRSERPQAHWQAPLRAEPPPEAPLVVPSGAPPGPAPAPAFRPADVGPMHPRFAAPGDGAWVAVPDPRRPDAPPLLHKTLLHPDPKRARAELFVVAFDPKAVLVHLVAGSQDPEATTAQGKAYRRPAMVAPDDRARLLAAFNGGFKTEHGRFGMRTDGVTLVPPRPDVCTLAAYDEGTLRIATWPALAPDEGRLLWWRQTPPCMVERGVLHPGLAADATTRWGAALGGETVIRRSAVGLSEGGDVFYVGVSEATTARALALGMQHAGARDVAQLDVNWSYPKFLVFRDGDGGLEAEGLFPGFAFEKGEYVRKRSLKDFFYVVRRAP